MSGYFVHGGTQYPYGQTQQQPTAQTNVPDLSYQQQAQTSQFYQSTTYPAVQSSRTTLSAAKPSGTYYAGSTFANQTLSQGYSTTQQALTKAFPSLDSSGSSSSAYNRTPATNAYGRVGYSNSSYGSSAFGAAKQDQKFSGSYGGYKTSPVGTEISSGSLNSAPASFYSPQSSQQAGYSTTYPVNAAYNKPALEEASSSQYSYEKALYVAANQYYLTKKAEQSGRGTRGGGVRGRGGRGKGGSRGGTSLFNQNAGPKVIKATEVKAYLYAWCGQRRLKPEYSIEPIGMPPRMKFCCTLHITGLDYIAKVTAASKKDSQSKAAWDFCEHLVKTGYMKQGELPPKPEDPAPKNMPPKPSTPAGTQPDTAETVEESGGWTLENCRQRMNQFTQRWRIPAEFKHETLGPEHARTFVAELVLKVKWLDKEFVAKERGQNKKQATAVCALAMVRQLYKEGLIEKQGDPIKHPRRPPGKESNGEDKQVKKPENASSAGTKRKAEESTPSEEIDEYGNWTLEGGRQRLHMFCQATNQTFEIKYAPDGNIPPKAFTASVSVEVTVDNEKRKLEKSYTCQGKKQAAQHCALEMIKELYNLSLLEANLGQQHKKKNTRQRNQMEPPPVPLMDTQFGPGFNPGIFHGGFGPFGPGLQRRTPYEDAIILEKHKRIYPPERELMIIQKSVRTIEAALKQVSDELAEPEPKEVKKDPGDELKVKPDLAKIKQEINVVKQEAGTVKEEADKHDNREAKRILQGVMRVGILAKGLLLKGDLSAHLVLLCTELPTVPLLTRISTILERVLEESGEKYLVELRTAECLINVFSPSENDPEKEENIRCIVKVSLTSPMMRTLTEPTTGPADMLDRDICIKSLAELRHAKWFQACANGLPSCVVLLRIFRDMRRRISTWVPLSEWALELLVEKSLRTSFGQLSVGEGLRRVLSCISSGILLEDGPGLYDPCEKEPTDVIGDMTLQEREDITESAHHALRMLVFRQTHKILGIEPMPARHQKRVNSGATEGDLTMDMLS